MNNLIKVLNYANEKRLVEVEKKSGYEENAEADWEDGNTHGIQTTYEDIIRFCADELQKGL